MKDHEQYLHRCLHLASMGIGNVSPNPMVGSVLVYAGRVIGEGYHAQYGQAHAEVNCINSVLAEDQQYISKATLYVSLEPCNHQGKTPPCTDLILQKQIRHVVVGAEDPFPAVSGKGIAYLRKNGVQVNTGVLEEECTYINRRFFRFHRSNRPYIILKWAQTQNGKLSSGGKDRLMISGAYSNRLVHRWRSEEAAIMVGRRTVELDDPSLNTRLWPGRNPVRIVVDPNLILPKHLKIFDRTSETILFNFKQSQKSENLEYIKLSENGNLIDEMLHSLYEKNIQSVLVEGGRTLLQSFIDKNLFDEIRIIENQNLLVDGGLSAPDPGSLTYTSKITFDDDSIFFYNNF